MITSALRLGQELLQRRSEAWISSWCCSNSSMWLSTWRKNHREMLRKIGISMIYSCDSSIPTIMSIDLYAPTILDMLIYKSQQWNFPTMVISICWYINPNHHMLIYKSNLIPFMVISHSFPTSRDFPTCQFGLVWKIEKKNRFSIEFFPCLDHGLSG